MKTRFAFFALALTIAGIAQAQPCNPSAIAENARQLRRETNQFQAAINSQPYYTALLAPANQLEEGARRLRRAAENGVACHRLSREFSEDVAGPFEDLRRQHRELQGQSPNAYVRDQFQQVRQAFQNLRHSIQSGPVVPPPPPFDPCQGLAGVYSGSCRIVNGSGASPIQFTVQAQGNQCVAHGGYFQPAALAIFNGQGSAAVHQVPGGVAIQNTTLAVYGHGRFAMNGYNYAGRFYFQCSP